MSREKNEKKINPIGIYAVKCKSVKKCFIGWSMNVDGRVRVLKSDLIKNRGNKFILDDYKKYGKDNFEIKVVERCLESMLLKRTQDYAVTVLQSGWSLYNENIIVVRIEGNAPIKDNTPEWIKKEVGEKIVKPVSTIPKTLFDIYYEEKCDIFEEEKGQEWLERVYSDDRLTDKQKLALKLKPVKRDY